ncbi:MAG: hypothetical protein KAR35_02205 [Candidatus Heimdallarchaeota archaeon]|nr:hypothetical protein [Candidatus Heimdallarchaeota archaeon]MCK5048167.1 hypothetical protein [Candidatus Heimdallarchaeota archaeon]
MSWITSKYTRYSIFAVFIGIFIIFNPSEYIWGIQLLIFAILIDLFMGRERIKSIEDTYDLEKVKLDKSKEVRDRYNQ